MTLLSSHAIIAISQFGDWQAGVELCRTLFAKMLPGEIAIDRKTASAENTPLSLKASSWKSASEMNGHATSVERWLMRHCPG
jgi:hypothetical protein